jgi:hypothetical protein
LLEGPDRFVQRDPASDGELDRPFRPIEEFDAEFALECLNLLRERRLRDAETHGGLSKMQFLRQN